MNRKQRRDADYDQREATLKEAGIAIERQPYDDAIDYRVIGRDGRFIGCSLQRGTAIKKGEALLERYQRLEQMEAAERNADLKDMQQRATKFSRFYHHGCQYVRDGFTFQELAKLLYDMVSFGGDDSRQGVKDVIDALDHYHK